MEEEFKYLLTVINMKDCTQMENLREMEIIIGIMELSIRVSLKMEFVMGMVNGVMVNRNMKGNTLMIRGMVKVFINGMVEAFIKDNFLMI